MYAVKKTDERGRVVYRYVTDKPDEARWLAGDNPVVAVAVERDATGGYWGWWFDKRGVWLHVFPSLALCEGCSPPRGGTVERISVREVPA